MTPVFDFSQLFHFLFGGDFPSEGLLLHQVMARAVLVYLAGIIIIRLGKSRSIGRFTPLDVIVGFILGSLLSRGITGSASLSATFAASVALVATHWLLTRLTFQWHWMGNLVKGRADVIVENGKMLDDNLRRHHISQHDLDEALRLKGISGLAKVRRAYKERNGEISFLE